MIADFGFSIGKFFEKYSEPIAYVAGCPDIPTSSASKKTAAATAKTKSTTPAATAEAAVEDAAGSSGVSFVLLLPPVDACAEASKKDKQGDGYCWRVDYALRMVCLTNETRTCPRVAKSDNVLLRDAAPVRLIQFCRPSRRVGVLPWNDSIEAIEGRQARTRVRRV